MEGEGVRSLLEEDDIQNEQNTKDIKAPNEINTDENNEPEEINNIENKDDEKNEDPKTTEDEKNEIQEIDDISKPNQTLYVKNLDDKIKLEELKQSLFHLFSQYGEIYEIHAKKSLKMRGQAFVVFKDLMAASEALRCLNHMMFFEREMNISFARNKSDIVTKIEGSYNPKIRQKRKIKRDQEQNNREVKRRKLEEEKAIQEEEEEEKEPGMVANNILFVEGLDIEEVDITEDMLEQLFKQYPGFREVRLIPTKHVAFVEYDDEMQSSVAMVGLNGFHIKDQYPLKITFAKK